MVAGAEPEQQAGERQPARIGIRGGHQCPQPQAGPQGIDLGAVGGDHHPRRQREGGGGGQRQQAADARTERLAGEQALGEPVERAGSQGGGGRLREAHPEGDRAERQQAEELAPEERHGLAGRVGDPQTVTGGRQLGRVEEVGCRRQHQDVGGESDQADQQGDGG
jgi:hypothetical protein